MPPACRRRQSGGIRGVGEAARTGGASRGGPGGRCEVGRALGRTAWGLSALAAAALGVARAVLGVLQPRHA
eukprot:56090-Alexandrium_andersonii.AAC.1